MSAQQNVSQTGVPLCTLFLDLLVHEAGTDLIRQITYQNKILENCPLKIVISLAM